RLHDIGPARPGILQHGCQVAHDAFGLRADVALHDLAGGWVERYLPRGEQEIARDDSLRVRADCRRGILGVDDANAHSSLLRTARRSNHRGEWPFVRLPALSEVRAWS